MINMEMVVCVFDLFVALPNRSDSWLVGLGWMGLDGVRLD